MLTKTSIPMNRYRWLLAVMVWGLVACDEPATMALNADAGPQSSLSALVVSVADSTRDQNKSGSAWRRLEGLPPAGLRQPGRGIEGAVMYPDAGPVYVNRPPTTLRF